MMFPSHDTVYSSQLKNSERFTNQKYKKLKGGCSANAMLVFNSWMKDIEMCMKEQKLTNMEAVQLMKGYTTEGARGAMGFYLDSNSMWKYHELIEQLRILFESDKTFSSLVGDIYSHIQWSQEREDQFADELQILGQKVISMRPSWKNETNAALKIQFASRLHDPYLAAMLCNLLKTQGDKMNFNHFWAECISMFGFQIKALKMKTATRPAPNKRVIVKIGKYNHRWSW